MPRPAQLYPLIVSALFAGWSLLGLAYAQPQTKTPRFAVTNLPKADYPVTNLPSAHVFVVQSPGESQEKQGLVWLDNRRVMFVGIIRGDQATKGLYIWDLATKTVTKYSNHTQFCYADGYIEAREIHPERGGQAEVPVRFGELGKEKDDVCSASNRKACHGFLNMSCKPRVYVGKPSLGEDSAFVLELRTGDGVIVDPTALPFDRLPKALEERKAVLRQSLLLLNERLPKGKPLGVTALEEIKAWRATYSSFGEKYVFLTERPSDGSPGYRSVWPSGRPQSVYLMNRNGDVEQVQVPSYPDWTRIHLAVVGVPGIVFNGVGGPPNEWGGLFLYDKREVRVLERGKVEAFAVAPDGCRVAYAIFNDYGKTPVNVARVKSMEFCRGK